MNTKQQNKVVNTIDKLSTLFLYRVFIPCFFTWLFYQIITNL